MTIWKSKLLDNQPLQSYDNTSIIRPDDLNLKLRQRLQSLNSLILGTSKSITINDNHKYRYYTDDLL